MNEECIRVRHEAGDLGGAMVAALSMYGDELYGFLVGLAGDSDRAGDLFGEVRERMWRGLPGFRWQSSFRVWAYAVARNEFLRSRREAARARRHVPLSSADWASRAAARARTETPAYERTDVKDALARVRAGLSPDDHMLLGLRIDRKMGWGDIARVLGSEPEHVARDAARLRKRFERLKCRLRELVLASRPSAPAAS